MALVLGPGFWRTLMDLGRVADTKVMGAKSLVKLDPSRAKMLMEGSEGGGDGSLFKLNASREQLGQADSLRYNVMKWVLDEKYDKAIKGLKEFQESPSEYPDFNRRVSRFIGHAIDLVHAIKAKRNFPGIHSLTRSKQFELREKFREHFDELQYILLKIEKVGNDLRIHDVRSTIYVVRALWLAAVAIMIMALTVEVLKGGLGYSVLVVGEDLSDTIIGWGLGLIGL